MRIGAVCDVGSMDGADALAFSAAVPHARIYAFEPNPWNLERMTAERAFRERNIEIVPAAVADRDGEADFFLVAAEYSTSNAQRGMSSLYRRAEWPPTEVVRVRTMRLDTFLAERCAADVRIALWVDVEGKAYEALEGITRIAGQVDLIHVEVENRPLIGSDQILYPQVRALVQRLGFAELATDQPPGRDQINMIYVRRHLAARIKCRLATRLLRARLRYLAFHLVLRVCPACIRHYRSLRARVASHQTAPGMWRR
jgi:FkbM family methyltransferase